MSTSPGIDCEKGLKRQRSGVRVHLNEIVGEIEIAEPAEALEITRDELDGVVREVEDLDRDGEELADGALLRNIRPKLVAAEIYLEIGMREGRGRLEADMLE